MRTILYFVSYYLHLGLRYLQKCLYTNVFLNNYFASLEKSCKKRILGRYECFRFYISEVDFNILCLTITCIVQKAIVRRLNLSMLEILVSENIFVDVIYFIQLINLLYYDICSFFRHIKVLHNISALKSFFFFLNIQICNTKKNCEKFLFNYTQFKILIAKHFNLQFKKQSHFPIM